MNDYEENTYHVRYRGPTIVELRVSGWLIYEHSQHICIATSLIVAHDGHIEYDNVTTIPRRHLIEIRKAEI